MVDFFRLTTHAKDAINKNYCKLAFKVQGSRVNEKHSNGKISSGLCDHNAFSFIKHIILFSTK